MKRRPNKTIAIPFISIAWVLAVLAGCSATDKRESPSEIDWRENPLGFVDRMITVTDTDSWAAGESVRVVATASDALTLDDPPGTNYPRNGRWTSPVYETDFPITEVLPSWNVDAPPLTGVKFFVRSRDARSSDWSPWLYIGSWGKTLPADKNNAAFEHGKVKIDYLVLDRPADALQLRAVLQSFEVDGPTRPTIHKLTAVYSGIVKDPGRRDELTEQVSIDGPWARTLDVPFVPQSDTPKALWSRVCSPTATTMILRYQGSEEPLLDNVLGIYDPETGIFGNWGRAVAYAGQLGYDAHLARVRTWDQVKAYIAQGQPIAISIRFESGTFPSNLMDQTYGHIVVIRGLTEQGHAVMNDGASRARGEGIIYRSDELARAWLRHGGIAYIIKPKDKTGSNPNVLPPTP